MTIFAKGGDNCLKVNLTILFIWAAVVIPLNLWSQKKRLERVKGVAR